MLSSNPNEFFRRNWFGALLVCGVAIAAVFSAVKIGLAQSVARPGYDIDFIGAPMADPVLQHSKETYVLFGCAYCHGLYLVARGEATDLMHSRLVGRDENANLIGSLLRAGIPQTAKLSPMPQFSDLSDQQIADIARWIHYARQQGRFKELMAAATAGDAAAGKSYFEQTCRQCHAADGDLAHIGAKHDATTLRATVLDPPRLRAEPSYRLDEMHDVKLRSARQRHHALLENYTAEEVANVVSYLQSVK
jgi:mono/diheme cytochrome c family protein